MLGLGSGLASVILGSWPAAVLGVALTGASVLLNGPFYRFIGKARGSVFMVRSIAFYSVMLLVILAGAGVGVVQHLLRRRLAAGDRR